MKAIILAAGRGSRLNELTEEQPKCMTKLGGTPLIHWQINALRKAGIEDITIVTGYLHDVVEGLGIPTVQNQKWASTNMVSSLMCATDLIDQPCIVSYSDIVYGADVVEKLLQGDAEISVAYDDNWLEQWQERFANPLDDAESLRLGQNGRLLEIGNKVDDIGEIQGQYLGLMQFTPAGVGWIKDLFKNPEIDPDKLDMTTLLGLLIAAGHPLQGVRTSGNWCEIDTQSDLQVAEKRLIEGLLKN